MYYKLDEKEFELMKRIEKQTMTNYEIKGDMIEVEAMMSALVDLYMECDHLKEQLEDIQEDLEHNYRAIPIKEQID